MFELFAVAAPGLEAALAEELGGKAVDGGVEFRGDAARLAGANLESRLATRILVRVGRVKARDFASLRKQLAALPWEKFAAASPTVEVSTSAKKCRLFHTGAIAERTVGAVADRMGAPAAGAPALSIYLRGEHDEFTVSVDSSGELLHRRGWRVDTAKASLRETLAAGMLALAGWDAAREPLVDPMCGAGTIAIEAALRAIGRPPGAARSFAFERWPGFARPRVKTIDSPTPPPIVAGDRDARAVELARKNAARAGVDTHVTFFSGDAAAIALPARPGLLIANPPYGARLSAGPSQAAYSALAALARRAAGWRLAVLAPEPIVEIIAGRARPKASYPLDNGGIRVRLALFDPQV